LKPLRHPWTSPACFILGVGCEDTPPSRHARWQLHAIRTGRYPLSRLTNDYLYFTVWGGLGTASIIVIDKRLTMSQATSNAFPRSTNLKGEHAARCGTS
jgi:hypothetical protein